MWNRLSHPFIRNICLLLILLTPGIGSISGKRAVFAANRPFAFSPPDSGKPASSEEAWTRLPDPFDSDFRRRLWALGVAPDGNLYAAGAGGVAVSADGGQHWRVINEGMTNPLVVTVGFNGLGEPVVGAGLKSGPIDVFRYTQGSWHKAKGITANYRISAFALDRTGALLAVTGWSGDVFRSTDHGNTFRKVASAVGTADGNALAALWQVFRASDGSLYTGGESAGGIYRSLDNGTTWQQDGLGAKQGFTGNLTYIGSNALDEVLAARTEIKSGSPLQRRTESGWVNSSTGLPTWHKVRGLVVTPSRDLYVAITGNAATSGIYHSTDNGRTWKRSFFGQPYTAMGEMAVDKSGAVYVIMRNESEGGIISIYKSPVHSGS